jgi:hypothetical protein
LGYPKVERSKKFKNFYGYQRRTQKAPRRTLGHAELAQLGFLVQLGIARRFWPVPDLDRRVSLASAPRRFGRVSLSTGREVRLWYDSQNAANEKKKPVPQKKEPIGSFFYLASAAVMAAIFLSAFFQRSLKT